MIFLVQIEWNKSNDQFRQTSARYYQKFAVIRGTIFHLALLRLMNARSCHFRSQYVTVESIWLNKQARSGINVWTSPSHRGCTRMHVREIAHARGFTMITAFPRKNIANGARYHVQNIASIRSIVSTTVEYYIRLIGLCERKISKFTRTSTNSSRKIVRFKGKFKMKAAREISFS